MEENLEKEMGGFRVAGAVMRLGLLFGIIDELLLIIVFLLAPLFLLELGGFMDFGNYKLPILIIAFISFLIYIQYIFISHKLMGRTFGQVAFKSVIVKNNLEKMEVKNIVKRIFVKFLTVIIWIGLGAITSWIIYSRAELDWKWLDQIDSSLFFAFLISPILLIPFLSKKTHTITDYFSQTKVLIDYEQIKQEERARLNDIIENPMLLLVGASTVSLVAVSAMVVVAYFFKMFKKRF